MREILNIGIHNFGGLASNPLASTQDTPIESINLAHKARWPEMKSALGSWIGYNLVILPSGGVVQTRLIGEETCAATGSNFNTFHICLAGNFKDGSRDVPIEAQKNTLKNILNAAVGSGSGYGLKLMGIKVAPFTNMNFSISRIYPHRVLQPNHTECYGNSLPDDWARRLILASPSPIPVPSGALQEAQLSLIAKLKLLVMQLQDILAKRKFGRVTLGSMDNRSCEGTL